MNSQRQSQTVQEGHSSSLAHLHGDVTGREAVEDVAAHICGVGKMTCGNKQRELGVVIGRAACPARPAICAAREPAVSCQHRAHASQQLLSLCCCCLTCHAHRHVACEDDGCCCHDGTQHADQLVGVGLGRQGTKRVVLCRAAAHTHM